MFRSLLVLFFLALAVAPSNAGAPDEPQGWGLIEGKTVGKCWSAQVNLTGTPPKTNYQCLSYAFMTAKQGGWLYECHAHAYYTKGQTVEAGPYIDSAQCAPFFGPSTNNSNSENTHTTNYSGEFATSGLAFPAINIGNYPIIDGFIYWTTQAETYDTFVCFKFDGKSICGPVQFSSIFVPFDIEKKLAAKAQQRAAAHLHHAGHGKRSDRRKRH